LPAVFDIFSPSMVHHPWQKTVLGSGQPAAIRNAGQNTA
jgi:hypothetical protein